MTGNHLISSSFWNGSSYSIYEIGDFSLTLIVLVATIRWRAPIRAKQRCPYLPSSHERLSCRVLLTVVLCSFHVVWSVPVIVILTIIYIIVTLITCKSIVLVNFNEQKLSNSKNSGKTDINILTFHISLITCSPRLFAVLRRLKLTFLGITADHYFSFPIPHSPFHILVTS